MELVAVLQTSLGRPANFATTAVARACQFFTPRQSAPRFKRKPRRPRPALSPYAEGSTAVAKTPSSAWCRAPGDICEFLVSLRLIELRARAHTLTPEGARALRALDGAQRAGVRRVAYLRRKKAPGAKVGPGSAARGGRDLPTDVRARGPRPGVGRVSR